MNPKNIRDNPSFKKFAEEADKISLFQKGWKYFRPFAKLIGINASAIDESLNKMDDVIAETDEFVNFLDQFNDLFSDRGWICFDLLNIDVIKTAVTLAGSDGIEQAESFLVDHFSPEWVKSKLLYLEHLKGFDLRYPLIEKAYKDYESGRYYSSVLVVLTQMDGIVNEFNISDHQRQGFFSKDSKVIAWDSIAAHEKGLAKLQEVFGLYRGITRIDPLNIPYRNGIIHGMDLGYDNEVVAAKCWAALFALRDWVIKVIKNEIIPPIEKPDEEISLIEAIEDYVNFQTQFEKNKQWKPREIIIGTTVPEKGEISEYKEDSPERTLVEFLNFWERGNYGYMSKCFSPDFMMNPGKVRKRFGEYHLNGFELINISDVIPTVSVVSAKLLLQNEEDLITSLWKFRLVRYTKDGKLANIRLDNTSWYIVNWENRK